MRLAGPLLASAGLALALVGAAPAARAGDGRTPHVTVLHPRRDAARAEIEAARRRLAEDRARWPRFLTDMRRAPRLHERGLLTGARAQARREKAGAHGTAAVDTVDVLLARIGFAANRAPELTSMHPSGDFRLEPDTTYIVDPPPHDADYFDAQFVALAAYWERMSFGQLVVRATVFPPQSEPSIKMSDMADYGPGANGNWTLELLERYFIDAVLALDAAAASRIDLREFDTFLFAHPGSDLQNDINRDSPNDLPTFSVTLAESLVVPVMAGSDTIAGGIVLPEALTQDGLVGGLLGSMVHEFGHQLGLPDWYDTYYGLPVVGEWDLMDSGNAAFFAFQVAGSDEVQLAYGLLPTGLSAVDRYLLGWDDPYVMQAPEDVVTLRPGNSVQGVGPRSARLDVSPDEYFLVENRRDLLYDHPDDVTPCPYLNRDAATGVVLWTSRDDDAKPSRERRNSGDYDFFIGSPTAPDAALGFCGELGFGLLVWHVDERVLAEGYAYNIVNVDETYRALRLVEASGDFEIGDWRMPTVSFFGDGYNDPFREGYATALRADTRPNNWNNDWAHTGWEITDVRFAAPESHTLYARSLDGVAGWPRVLRAWNDTQPLLEPASAVHTEIAGFGPALVVADSAGLRAFWAGGSRRLWSGPLLPGSLAGTPRLAVGDAYGSLAATDGSRVWVWDAALQPDSLLVRSGFPVVLPGGTGDRLTLLDLASGVAGVLVERADGGYARIDAAGVIGEAFDAEPGARARAVVGHFDAENQLTASLALVASHEVVFGPLLLDGPGPQAVVAHGLDAPDSMLLAAGARFPVGSDRGQVVVLRRDGQLRVVDPIRGVLAAPFRDLPAGRYVGLAVADVNGDGGPDIVAASETGIAVQTSQGAALLETPVELRDVFSVQRALQVTSGPVVADVAGDELPEILVGTDLGLVYALDATGRVVEGYPRKLQPDLVPATLLAEDVDGDGACEIVAVSAWSAGALSPPGGSGRPGWTAPGGDPARTRFAVPTSAIAAGERLQARERPLLAYPNPARDGFVQLRITARQSGPYALAIYNLEGQKVFEQQGNLDPGTHEIAWSCAGMASGVYLCRFVSAAAGVGEPLVEPITLLR